MSWWRTSSSVRCFRVTLASQDPTTADKIPPPCPMKHLKQRRGPLFCTPQHIMEGSDRWVSMAEDMDSYQNDPCLRKPGPRQHRSWE